MCSLWQLCTLMQMSWLKFFACFFLRFHLQPACFVCMSIVFNVFLHFVCCIFSWLSRLWTVWLSVAVQLKVETTCSRESSAVFTARRYANAVLAVALVSVCLSVSLSQIRVLSKWLNKSSWFLVLSHTVLLRNSGTTKNNGTSLWNFVLNSSCLHRLHRVGLHL